MDDVVITEMKEFVYNHSSWGNVFLKTLRKVIMRVYFVDLITVYKTICQFPVVSIVNSRTPVIFQMWLPP